MLFLTGAAGKTGRSILRALAASKISAKVLVRSSKQADSIRSIGDFEVVLGDLRDPSTYKSGLQGVDKIYYICPNIAPDELEIGNALIKIAQQNNIQHFIYHSVLHPQIEAMPHHWQKLRMEETLFTSGIDFTVLQPCAYMQNVLAGWKRILDEGKYVVPYQISSRLSIVDLNDVGEAAARIISGANYANAIFELAGPEPLSQSEVAAEMSAALKRPIKAIEQSRDDWKHNAQQGGMEDRQIDVLLKMFEYYDLHGLVGNPWILENLLNRKPTTFKEFLVRILNSGEE